MTRPAATGPASAAGTTTPILHVDMDAFFASVALRDRPELHDRPVAVGGGYRGVVVSANYHARRCGVRSAMSSARARRLCPDLVSVPADHEEVGRVSAAVMDVFRRVTPLVEVVSVDEAFLDVRGATRLLGTPEQIAERVRAAIADEQRITCSVGVAPTVSVAKLASRQAKPDGVRVVEPEQMAAFLRPLDVGELHGVGPTTRARLHRLGLTRVADLADLPVEELRRRVGSGADHLHQLATGTDRDALHQRQGPSQPDRSMGAQETFGRDLHERADLVRELLRLAERVTARLRAGRVAGRTVVLTARFSDFTTVTRSRALPEPTDVTHEVFATVVALLDALERRGRPLRLVGVRVEGLVPRAGVQRQLVLGQRERGWAEADRAVDAATGRFGRGAVRPASLLVGGRGSSRGSPSGPTGPGGAPRG